MMIFVLIGTAMGNKQKLILQSENETNGSVEMESALNQFLESIVVENESFRLACSAHTF